jgi:hypothetical protein
VRCCGRLLLPLLPLLAALDLLACWGWLAAASRLLGLGAGLGLPVLGPGPLVQLS